VFGGGFALGLILSTSGDSTHAAQEAEDRRQAQAAAKPAAVSTPATPPDDDCEIFCTQSNPVLKPTSKGEVAQSGGEPTSGSVTFGHGARHLEGTNLTQFEVESAIAHRISSEAARVTSQTGSFWGRIELRGTVIEYRAFTLPDGTINVGTYYVP
jgi:hypothetical protein